MRWMLESMLPTGGAGAGVSGEVKVHKRTVQGIRQGELKLEEQEL